MASGADDERGLVHAAALRRLLRCLPQKRSFRLSFRHRFKATFLEGLAYCIPAVITVWFFYQILSWLYDIVSSLLDALSSIVVFPVEFRIPANLLGVTLTFILVLFVGLLFETFFGKVVRRAVDSFVRKIPFVSSIYDVFSQLSDAVFTKSDSFSSPVMVPFPHEETSSIGFATGEADPELASYLDGPAVKVFIPTTPIPTAGFLLFYPKEMVGDCGLSREEAFTLILSGGLMEGNISTQASPLSEERERGFFGKIGSTVFKGLLVLLPFFITAYITLRIFAYLYDVFSVGSQFLPEEAHPLLDPLLVAATFLATLLFIWLVGIVVRSFMGKQLRRFVHGVLKKIPPSDAIYRTLRQLMRSLIKKHSTTDARVVLLDFPFKGVRVIGFFTGKAVRNFGSNGPGSGSEDRYKVFVPGTPNPTAGFFILASKKDFIETTLSAEQGLKIALSGGILKSSGGTPTEPER